MRNEQIEHLSPDTLKPSPRNARTHSNKQVRQIAASIRAFGFVAPVLIDEDGNILAGHGRVAAAKELVLESIPCRRVGHLSPAQKRAYALADNKIALNAGWDEQLLAEELDELASLSLDFDIETTGFSIPEIDLLVDGLAPEEPGDPADDELGGDGPPRCQSGDLWGLGPHRLICGDALDKTVVDLLMDGEDARMVFTDPPYNVAIDGHVCGSGKIKHREFAMASGEMTAQEFTAFLERAFRNLSDHSVNGAIHFICMDWRHMNEILAAGSSVYSELKNLIVWAKDNGGMGTFYRSRHELIFAYKFGDAPHVNAFELGQYGRVQPHCYVPKSDMVSGIGGRMPNA